MLSASWTDEDGDERTAEGESVEAVSLAMREQGYCGPKLKVVDEAGWVRGWANDYEWRAQ